jgi:hypothetical protein
MSKFNQQKMFEGIVRWQQSGLSQITWCKKNNIPYSVFHYWYRRFRNQQISKKQRKSDGFVQLLVQDPASVNPWCELVLGDGKKLLFHQHVPVEFIRNLLD